MADARTSWAQGLLMAHCVCAARFSVRFRDLFGQRRVGRACRRMTHTVDKLGNVQRTSSNSIDPLRIPAQRVSFRNNEYSDDHVLQHGQRRKR